jgi:hypothetical protein
VQTELFIHAKRCLCYQDDGACGLTPPGSAREMSSRKKKPRIGGGTRMNSDDQNLHHSPGKGRAPAGARALRRSSLRGSDCSNDGFGVKVVAAPSSYAEGRPLAVPWRQHSDLFWRLLLPETAPIKIGWSARRWLLLRDHRTLLFDAGGEIQLFDDAPQLIDCCLR